MPANRKYTCTVPTCNAAFDRWSRFEEHYHRHYPNGVFQAIAFDRRQRPNTDTTEAGPSGPPRPVQRQPNRPRQTVAPRPSVTSARRARGTKIPAPNAIFRQLDEMARQYRLERMVSRTPASSRRDRYTYSREVIDLRSPSPSSASPSSSSAEEEEEEESVLKEIYPNGRDAVAHRGNLELSPDTTVGMLDQSRRPSLEHGVESAVHPALNQSHPLEDDSRSELVKEKETRRSEINNSSDHSKSNGVPLVPSIEAVALPQTPCGMTGTNRSAEHSAIVTPRSGASGRFPTWGIRTPSPSPHGKSHSRVTPQLELSQLDHPSSTPTPQANLRGNTPASPEQAGVIDTPKAQSPRFIDLLSETERSGFICDASLQDGMSQEEDEDGDDEMDGIANTAGAGLSRESNSPAHQVICGNLSGGGERKAIQHRRDFSQASGRDNPTPVRRFKEHQDRPVEIDSSGSPTTSTSVVSDQCGLASPQSVGLFSLGPNSPQNSSSCPMKAGEHARPSTSHSGLGDVAPDKPELECLIREFLSHFHCPKPHNVAGGSTGDAKEKLVESDRVPMCNPIASLEDMLSHAEDLVDLLRDIKAMEQMGVRERSISLKRVKAVVQALHGVSLDI